MDHILADCKGNKLEAVAAIAEVQKGSSPASDLPIQTAGSGGTPHIPPTPGYALSHSSHATESLQVVVGDGDMCPGAGCSLYGKPHRHELSKGQADPGSFCNHLMD